MNDLDSFTENLGAATIPELAAASADLVPDRAAVTIGGHSITHAELDAGAAGVAGWLARRLAPGERLLLAAKAGPGFLFGYLGALRAGAVVVLANPGYTAPELAHLVSDSGATIAFADAEPARLLARLASPPLVIDPSQPPQHRPAAVRAQPDDIALLAYTSGTSGRPKGVPLTHRQLATSIRAAMKAWRWSEEDVLVHALPLFHQHGLGGVHATLIAGSTAHIMAKFDAPELARTVRATHASVLFGVPTIYQALLSKVSQADAPALACLRLAVCGSAPLSPHLVDKLASLLGQPPLVRYGTTETGLDISHAISDRRAGTVGVPLPGVSARIRLGNGDAAPGDDGEIQLRGQQVSCGYWRDDAATELAFTSDGWFRTGDIGHVDQLTGHLVIQGRMKEMIISGGLNVYPREVETVLENHPAVQEAAVAGVADERWGEQVTAWVVTRPGCRFAEQEIIAYAHTALASYKCPKRVFQLPTLPRNHLGKVLRGELASSAG